MEMIWVWLAVVAVSLIVEFITWDLTSIWFAVAGLISLILSAIEGISWVWQLVVFIVISALLIVFVRQICKKLLLKSDEKTNIDAYIGKRTKLISGIGANEDFGTVKFNGVVWNAKTEDNSTIAENSEVEVVKVEGNKLIVKLVANSENAKPKDDENKIKENATKNEEKPEGQAQNEENKEAEKPKKGEK